MKTFADETDKILVEVDRDEAHFLIDVIQEKACRRCDRFSSCPGDGNDFCTNYIKQLRNALGEDEDGDN